MKAIQITIDERLLAQLDADDEVKRQGRSAVLRRAAADYLRKKRRGAVADAYRRGYGKQPPDADLAGWADRLLGVMSHKSVEHPGTTNDVLRTHLGAQRPPPRADS